MITFLAHIHCLMYPCACSVAQLPHGLWPTRLLSPWDSPGKNTGVGGHVCLQGIFQTQGSNLCLLHWQVGSLPLSHLGSPLPVYVPSLKNRRGGTYLVVQCLRVQCRGTQVQLLFGRAKISHALGQLNPCHN